MVNIDDYKNDGWGISKIGFTHLIDILNKFTTPNIVEFGSGISTKFFIDYLNNTNKNGKLTSFENDYHFSSKIDDPKLILNIVDLLECDDESFNSMFINKKYNHEKMVVRTIEPTTRQKNCFYNITSENIPNNIDIVLLDGPNGNGRSLAFIHLKNKLKKGSYIFIDDYDHYNFVHNMKSIFNDVELIYKCKTGMNNQWNLGGNFVIYKII